MGVTYLMSLDTTHYVMADAHIPTQAPESGSSEAYEDAVARIEWIDALVRHLNNVPSARDRLLVTVILGSHGSPLPGLLLRGGHATDNMQQVCLTVDNHFALPAVFASPFPIFDQFLLAASNNRYYTGHVTGTVHKCKPSAKSPAVSF